MCSYPRGVVESVGGLASSKWQCQLCGKPSASRANLDKHMRVHTGERPFSCRVCKKRFNDKSAIFRHLRNVHHVDNAADYIAIV